MTRPLAAAAAGFVGLALLQPAGAALAQEIPPDFLSRFYIRGGLGYAGIEDSPDAEFAGVSLPDSTLTEIEHDDAGLLELGFGYRISPMLRTELNLHYRDEADGQALAFGALTGRYQTKSLAFIADAYVDVPQLSLGPVVPFLTAGAGVTRNTFEGGPVTAANGAQLLGVGDHADYYFLWRVGAGLSWQADPRWAIDLTYRYVDYDKVYIGSDVTGQFPPVDLSRPLIHQPGLDLSAQTIMLGVRYSFGAPGADVPDLGIPAKSGKGFYVRADTGMSQMRDPDLTIDDLGLPLEVDLDRSFLAGGGVGYRFNEWLRVDATVSRAIGYDQYSFRSGQPTGAAELNSTTFMGNVYVDLPPFGAIRPYVGGGIGAAVNEYGDLTINDGFNRPAATVPSATETNFAWQAGAGVGIALDQNLILDVGYRYVDRGTYRNSEIAYLPDGTTRSDLQSSGTMRAHELQLGLRYEF